MEQANSTTVVVVGPGSGDLIDRLDELPNVRGAHLALESDAAARGFVQAAHTSYVVHDRDPLEHVGAAWVEFFEDRVTLDTLDLEVETTVTALRNGAAAMPDYYLVLEPESLPGTWKHWWLGVLPEASPTRVIPTAADPGRVRRLLRALPTGRPWPDPDRWLGRLRGTVPDRAGLGG